MSSLQELIASLVSGVLALVGVGVVPPTSVEGGVPLNDTPVELSVSEETSVSRDEAITIATERFAGSVVRVEQGKEVGVSVWNIRIVNAENTKRADMRINAETGTIIRFKTESVGAEEIDEDEVEDENETEDDGVPAGTVTEVTRDEASAIALTQLAGTITKMHLDMEDGVPTWKVRVVNVEGTRLDIRIDATTGDILRSRIKMENENKPDKEVKSDSSAKFVSSEEDDEDEVKEKRGRSEEKSKKSKSEREDDDREDEDVDEDKDEAESDSDGGSEDGEDD